VTWPERVILLGLLPLCGVTILVGQILTHGHRQWWYLPCWCVTVAALEVARQFRSKVPK
jgi:hypothetical protein